MPSHGVVLQLKVNPVAGIEIIRANQDKASNHPTLLLSFVKNLKENLQGIFRGRVSIDANDPERKACVLHVIATTRLLLTRTFETQRDHLPRKQASDESLLVRAHVTNVSPLNFRRHTAPPSVLRSI